MTALTNIHKFVGRGHRVTVIGPSDHHYYSGMGPGMLGGTYDPEDIRFDTRRVVLNQGGVFLKDRVIRIDPATRHVFTASGREIPYDVLSLNAGSFVPWPDDIEFSDRVYATKPIERLVDARRKLADLSRENAITVGVVGGGAAAVEVAGNVAAWLSRVSRHPFEVVLVTRGELLSDVDPRVRKKCRHILTRRGVRIQTGTRVTSVRYCEIEIDSGECINVDMVLLAAGIRPNRLFADSDLPVGPDGGLRVNRFLQSVAYDNIFGGGDCIYFEDRPLDKVGVYAVRQNPVLYHNLMAGLDGGTLEAFGPGGDYILIFNMGNRIGVFLKNRLVFSGRLAFFIKNWIDCNFMRTFQAYEK
jgi:NADH dehydrogenase FAD-containing subunit